MSTVYQHHKKDLTGERFGRLLVIERTLRKGKDGAYYWKCLCVCGNYHIVHRMNLLGRQVNSCGCLQLTTTDLSNARALYNTYFRNAKKANLQWGLVFEDFYALIKKDCFYCGKVPQQIITSSSKHTPLIYNGIDKKVPKLGYIQSNCVSCCKQCNHSKWTMEETEWIQHLKNILSYYEQNKNSFT